MYIIIYISVCLSVRMFVCLFFVRVCCVSAFFAFVHACVYVLYIQYTSANSNAA